MPLLPKSNLHRNLNWGQLLCCLCQHVRIREIAHPCVQEPNSKFLSLSLDFLREHQVHVKQSRLDPKVPFLVSIMLNLIFLIQNRREAKWVLLCISFLQSMPLLITFHRFAKPHPTQVVWRVFPGVSLCCRVSSGSPGQSLLRFQCRAPPGMKIGRGTGSFCPTGTVLEWW